MSSCISRVVCGISGGVDSAVAALQLKNKGYEVLGVFMRNWDTRDEKGTCTIDEDAKDAAWICDKLKIPFQEVNLVKEYWNEVFADFLKEYENGFTPNPDILCNRNIKFGHFFKYATKELKADRVAMGHYAQVGRPSSDSKVKLIRAVDRIKDQTFFLSQIPQKSLQRCIFPNGTMLKEQVKQLATEAGLDHIANKKESMGICFVGKRNFKNFIDEYIIEKPGKFIDIDSNCVVGNHKGIHHYTVGQRSRIAGLGKPYYVVKKDVRTQNIYVAMGHTHPSFYADEMLVENPYWIYEEPDDLANSKELHCQFRFQNKMDLVNCYISRKSDDEMIVRLTEPLRSLTPGQYAVFYKGNECLGSARISEASMNEECTLPNISESKIS